MHVTVAGGGLAGMTAAIRLLERGCAVSIYEGSARLGGKAGAERHGADFDEHGYHIFPDWYANTHQLIRELGIAGDFLDCADFFQLEAGAFPAYRNYKNITSWRFALQNLFAGVLPVPDAFLFYYAALDLMSQPYSYRDQLDQVTVSGFLRSRFYRTNLVLTQFEELMLKGISVPTYEVSAMTMRNVMRFWVRSPEPMHRILRGNLQELWIDPLRKRIEELGGEIHLNHQLVKIEAEGGRIARLRFLDGQGQAVARETDRALLALPFERVTPLIDDALYALDPALVRLRYLRARAMAAFNVYCKRRLDGFPARHVNLTGSRFGISFIDVSQIWPGRAGTELNCIASDFTALEALSRERAVSSLLEDLRRYYPHLTDAEIERIDYQPHVNEPLFMNNVGGWAFRPQARTGIANLYLAGDYCRSHVDLVCMEGAIATALLAAEAIRADGGLPRPIQILEPPVYPDWFTRLLKILGAPFAAVAYGFARLLSTSGGR